jgi:antitoxin component of MazEF toxin-antitoxin module
MMEIVKVRRVGNSNVVSLPKAFVRAGYAEGLAVIIEQLETGELLLTPVSSHQETVRARARELIQRRGPVLERLKSYESGEITPPPRPERRTK